MSEIKQKKKAAKKQLQDARAILFAMENYLNGKDHEAIELACSFFHMLNYHFEEGDLRPSNVHLASLLRRACGL